MHSSRYSYQHSPFIISRRSAANERHPTRNEDYILIEEVSGLFAVFDGVGGSAAAEIASQTAANATINAWKRILTKEQNKRKVYNLLEDCQERDLCQILESLILESDEQVRTNGADRAGTDDLATTVALATFCRQPETNDYSMVYAHVGDSRIYLLHSEEGIKRLTNDDGLLTKLVENQIVDEQHASRIDQAMRADQLSDIEYSYFRLRGGITQALGGPLPPTIHTAKTTIHPGDRILLCTDGIHDNLTDEEIENIIRTSPRTAAARILVEHARQRSHEDRSQTIRSKPDDMSAIVMTCRI
jgi:protein phosphatase